MMRGEQLDQAPTGAALSDEERPNDEHDHGPTARLLDEVWCVTCQHTHIATIPATTFRCAGDERPCGFGCWGATIASAHAASLPDHIVHPVLHQTVPLAARDAAAAGQVADTVRALADEYDERSGDTEDSERYPWGVAADDLRAALDAAQPLRREADIAAEALEAAARDARSSPSTRLGDQHPGEVWADWLDSRAAALREAGS
jgi:hypothetical protein